MDGLSYHGIVTAYTDATHFKIDGLAGWGDNYFFDWYIYVVRDAGGAGAAPQGEIQSITDYASTDGTFTHVAFTVPLAIGDEVLIIQKRIASTAAGFEEGAVWIDTAGTDSTAAPYGTPTHPTSTIPNGLIIAAANELTKLKIVGTHTITSDISNYTIERVLGHFTAITLGAGVTNADTHFIGCTISGTSNGNGFYDHCIFYGMADLKGIVYDSILQGLIALTDPDPALAHTTFNNVTTHQWLVYIDCSTLTAPVGGRDITFNNLSGYLEFINLGAAGAAAANETIHIHSSTGAIIVVNATCTRGTVNVYGNAYVTDGGGGTTVNDYTVNNSLERQLHILDFWSEPQEEVQLTDTVAPGTDVALPSVTVADLPANVTVERVIAMFKFRIIENTNAAVNKLQGGQHIQVESDAPGTYRDAISFVDDMFTIAANTREAGDVIIGDHDIAIEVDAHGNDTYLFKWEAALVDQANLQFDDAQTGLRIWYSV